MLSIWNCLTAFFDVMIPYILIRWFVRDWHYFTTAMWKCPQFRVGFNDTWTSYDLGFGTDDSEAKPFSCPDYHVTWTPDDMYQGHHPTYVASIVAARWITAFLSLLNVEAFGKQLLPVYLSVKSKESVLFLFYLLIMLVGMFHMYYSFPLTQDDTDMPHSALRIFRLFFLADFDFFDLEGVDGVTTGPLNLKNGEADFTSDDGDDSKVKFKYGIMVFMIATLFVGPILFMNTFITVLGNVYEDKKKSSNAHLTLYRINSIKLLMLRQLVFQNTQCCVFKLMRGMDRLIGSCLMGFLKFAGSIKDCICCAHIDEHKQTEADYPATGIWIRLPDDCMETGDDDEPVNRDFMNASVEETKDRLDCLEDKIFAALELLHEGKKAELDKIKNNAEEDE